MLSHDVPVLCEKPLAYTLHEADALTTSDRLQLGYMKLFDAAVVRAATLARRLGALRSLEVTVLHPSIQSQVRHVGQPLHVAEATHRAASRSLLERALGPAATSLGALYIEVLLGSVIHELALVRKLSGDPVSIDFVETWPDDRWPSSVEIAGKLSGDARLSIRWHYLADRPAYREHVALHFEDGSLALEFPSPFHLGARTTLAVCSSSGDAEDMPPMSSSVGAFEAQLSAFHRLVTSGGVPVVNARQGRADIVTCQRIVKALAGRRGLDRGR